jgi:PKD repeat protein
VLDSSKITTKKWSFGDGSKSKQGGTVHHTYRHTGHYTVKLTVKDNRGQHVVAKKQIHVR